MKIWSPDWTNGEPMPPRLAAARIGADGSVVPSANRSPALAWSDLPRHCRSLALLAHDFDMPAGQAPEPPAVGAAAPPVAELSVDSPREEFFHWVLVDLPPTASGFAEGQWGEGFVAGGKPHWPAAGPARQGLNDFTRWFAGDARWRGHYRGYDGPLPPAHDGLVHHYLFTLFALDVERLALPEPFDGPAVREAMAAHVLDSATLSGTYTLNPRLARP